MWAFTLALFGVARREGTGRLHERADTSVTEFYWVEQNFVLAQPDDPDIFASAGATRTSRRPRLVLTMSEGSRPWFDNITREKLQGYANRTNADYLVITSKDVKVPESVVAAWTNHLIGKYSRDKSIRNNTAYVVKMLAISQALSFYDRVLWLDDSVYPSKHAADIFNECYGIERRPAVCAYSEGASHRAVEATTYNGTRDFLKGFDTVPPPTCIPADYLNTGVTVYDQSARPLVAPEALAAGMPYFGVFLAVEQCYLCVMLGFSALPRQVLSHKWNHVPYLDFGDLTPADPESMLGGQRVVGQASQITIDPSLGEQGIHLFHVTHYISRPTERELVIEQLRDLDV